MKRIDFSYNWNRKLDCKYFTTLRISHEYDHVGELIDVYLNDEFVKRCRIVEVRKIKMAQINAYIAGLDTGYSAEECCKLIKTMYKKANYNWNTQEIRMILLQEA